MKTMMTAAKTPATTVFLLLALALPNVLSAQTVDARPEDVASPEAAVAATYEAINREPGEDRDWDRFRSIFVPGAVLIPDTEQTGGEFLVLSVDEFISWVDDWEAQTAPIGSAADRGFYEEPVHAVEHRYGNVVQIMSTYQTRFADSDNVLERGINAFTLVFDGEGWRIAAVAWDEESGAGPIPAKYLP